MSIPNDYDYDPTPTRVLRAVPDTARSTVRLTTRGKAVLWALWFAIAYWLSPIAEFWWTKF